MKTLKITKTDLDNDNYYSGKEILFDYNNPFDGNIEIDENLGWVGFKTSLVVSGSIIAGTGSGIKAGEGIICKLVLSFKYNLFAGTSIWKKAEGSDKKIICGKLEGGEVKYGDVEETGLPQE